MRFKNIIPCLLSVLFGSALVACSIKSVDFSHKNEEKITVLGELSPEGDNKLSVYYAANLLTKGMEKPIENAEVFLVDSESKERVDYSYTKDGIWAMSQNDFIVSGRSYQLKIDDGRKQVSSVVRVPKALQAKVQGVKKDENMYTTTVEIMNPHNETCFCLVRMLAKNYRIENKDEKIYEGKFQSVPVASQDPFLINNINNEIPAPYKVMFFELPAHQKVSLTYDTVLYFPHNTDFYLWVKSLESPYYLYRYKSLVQTSNNFDGVMNVIPIITNIEHGVGFWGACRTLEISVDLPL